jgi:hypothetical protein
MATKKLYKSKSLFERQRLPKYIDDGLSKELKASLVNKRVDREHHTSNEQGGEGESKGIAKLATRLFF